MKLGSIEKEVAELTRKYSALEQEVKEFREWRLIRQAKIDDDKETYTIRLKIISLIALVLAAIAAIIQIKNAFA